MGNEIPHFRATRIVSEGPFHEQYFLQSRKALIRGLILTPQTCA
jgi:hypothetical protein